MRLPRRLVQIQWLGVALCGLLSLFSAPIYGQEPAKKLPLPGEAARKEALVKIERQIKELGNKSKTELTAWLIKQAGQVKVSAEQYVSLQRAWEIAAAEGDFSTAYWAVDEASDLFALDNLPIKAGIVKSAAKAVKSPEAAVELVDQARKLIAAAVERDDYPLALDVAQATEAASRKSKDLPLVLAVRREQKWIGETQAQYQSLKPFLERLQKDRTDPEANLQVGKYYCFLKGDWDRGLFLLAQSNDKKLRLLAQRDLIKPESMKFQLAQGNAWWEQSDSYQGQTRVHVRQRAAFWYQQALYTVDATEQAKLEERIASVPPAARQAVPWDYSGQPGEIKNLGNHFGNVFAVAFSPDGKFVASGGSDSQAVLWDLKTGKKTQFIGHGSTVWSVAFDAKSKYLYTSSWDGTARKWDLQTHKTVQTYPPQNNIFGSMYGLALSPDGKQLLTGGSDNAVRLWDAKTGKLIHTLKGHNGPVYGVTFFAGGKKAVSCGSFDHWLIVWDLDKGKEIRRINNPGNNGRYVAVSPDGTKVVATGEADVRMWDLRNGEEIRRFKGHTSPVYSVAFSPSGKRLLTGSLDATMRYWDVTTGLQIHVFKGFTSTVYTLAFSPGGGRAVTGGLDNTVRLWGLPR